MSDNDRIYDVDTFFDDSDSDISMNVENEEHDIEEENNMEEQNNLNDKEKINIDSDGVCPPYVGQIFTSIFEVEKYYNAYAHNSGFEVKILTSRKHSGSNQLAHRLYACRKAGRPIKKKNLFENENDDESIIRRKRDIIERTMCKARMFVVHNVQNNSWRVTKVELNHNHSIVTPSKIDFMATHKNITVADRELINLLHRSKIKPSLIMNVLSTMSGGRTNVKFTVEDIRNVIRNLRHDAFDANDAQEVLTVLKRLKSESVGNFFYNIKVDEENRIACIMWVDSRSIICYRNFGDVVTFDTTYRTNKYGMPFVPITGVNHHYQSILFGFALIKDETEDTFVWVLENWLEAVENKIPLTIITDQDRAMNNAIATVLPSTKHLICTWHISNKFPEKLHHLYNSYETFKEDFDRCLYSVTTAEFEERWAKLVEQYDLQHHEWLQSMYNVKEKWIGAYSKSYFAAGMTTTGRSESMNSFFDQYVNNCTGLKDFVINSQIAIEKQYLNERKQDLETEYKTRNLRNGTLLEKHAAVVYTKNIFKDFSNEFYEGQKLTCRKIQNFGVGGTKGYTVFNEEVPQNRRYYYVVVKHGDSDNVTCICQRFEHSGMICRHILRYITFKSINEIPMSLICGRWTRNANKIHGDPVNINEVNAESNSDVGDISTIRYNHLNRVYQEIAAIGSTSQSSYMHGLETAMKEKAWISKSRLIEENDTVEGGSRSKELHMEGGSIDEEDEYFPPLQSQTKGRKKVTRFKSGIEQIQFAKRLRKCAICQEYTDHDKRNHDKVMEIRSQMSQHSTLDLDDDEEEA